jgi:hypothetical protein
LENASRAFLDAVRKSRRRGAIGAATINPNLLTAAERLEYEGCLRREPIWRSPSCKGRASRSRRSCAGLATSRGLVRRVLRGQRSDVFRVRESSLELHLPWLKEQWATGQRNGAALWRQLKSQGFRRSLRVVTEWATHRRRAEKADSGLTSTPSSRAIARLMTIGRDRLSEAETVIVTTVESGVPLLVEAREIIATFRAMIHRNSSAISSPGWGEPGRAWSPPLSTAS